jgi:hypothetical protein
MAAQSKPRQRVGNTAAGKSGSGRKLSDLTPAELGKIHAFLSGLFADLKKDWESRPENQGKTAKYADLWKEYVAATKELEQPRRPPR